MYNANSDSSDTSTLTSASSSSSSTNVSISSLISPTISNAATHTPNIHLPFTCSNCYLKTEKDVLLILHKTIIEHKLAIVQRRLSFQDRAKYVVNGNVFVFKEKESGIKRWTDGLTWSSSRLIDKFLVYKQQKQDATGNTEENLLYKKTFSLKFRGDIIHIISYYNQKEKGHCYNKDMESDLDDDDDDFDDVPQDCVQPSNNPFFTSNVYDTTDNNNGLQSNYNAESAKELELTLNAYWSNHPALYKNTDKTTTTSPHRKYKKKKKKTKSLNYGIVDQILSELVEHNKNNTLKTLSEIINYNKSGNNSSTDGFNEQNTAVIGQRVNKIKQTSNNSISSVNSDNIMTLSGLNTRQEITRADITAAKTVDSNSINSVPYLMNNDINNKATMLSTTVSHTNISFHYNINVPPPPMYLYNNHNNNYYVNANNENNYSSRSNSYSSSIGSSSINNNAPNFSILGSNSAGSNSSVNMANNGYISNRSSIFSSRSSSNNITNATANISLCTNNDDDDNNNNNNNKSSVHKSIKCNGVMTADFTRDFSDRNSIKGIVEFNDDVVSRDGSVDVNNNNKKKLPSITQLSLPLKY